LDASFAHMRWPTPLKLHITEDVRACTSSFSFRVRRARA
jgi:hypothetical protein